VSGQDLQVNLGLVLWAFFVLFKDNAAKVDGVWTNVAFT
jgi:hypothetical protein